MIMKTGLKKAFKILLKLLTVAVVLFSLIFIYAMGYVSGEKNIANNSVITVFDDRIRIQVNNKVYDHRIDLKGDN